jgi:peptidoglycan-associated lipoprotein
MLRTIKLLLLCNVVFLFSCSSLQDFLTKKSGSDETEEISLVGGKVDTSNAIDGQDFFTNRDGFEVDNNQIAVIDKGIIEDDTDYNDQQIASIDTLPNNYYNDNDFEMQDQKEAALISVIPIRKKEIKEKIKHNTSGMKFKIYFDFDKDEVSKADISEIEKHSIFMKQHNNFNLRLLGHTDTRGSREYNLALGEDRALAIKKILKLYGITQVDVVSYGEERPLVKGETEVAWQKNRRVEFIYY